MLSRIELPGCVSTYALLGPHEFSATGGHQVGVALSAHPRLVREHDGRTERSDAPLGAVYVTADRPIHWHDVSDPTEGVEVYWDPDDASRVLGAALEVEPALAVQDGVMFAIGSRLRRAHLEEAPLSDLEASALSLRFFEHVSTRYGGRPVVRRRTSGALSDRAVDRLAEVVRADPSARLSIDVLAEVVALSPFHFARSFRATTGVTPHVFVLEHRLTLARDALRRSRAPVAEVARAAGFVNVSHFRRLFRRRFGVLPGAFRATS